MKNCPINNIELEKIKDKDIYFSFCKICDGLWINQNEILHILNKNNLKYNNILLSNPSVNTNNYQSKDKLKCDCIDGVMLEQKIIYNTTVEICPNCKSIWFDAGELNKIIKKINLGNNKSIYGYSKHNNNINGENLSSSVIVGGDLICLITSLFGI